MSLNALLLLGDDLHTNHGFEYFLINRLNQDCIENLFSVICGKGVQRDNPDAVHLRVAFRQVMVDRVLLTSDSANYKDDLDSFLFKFTTVKSISNAQAQPDHIASDIPEHFRAIIKGQVS